MMKTFWKVKLRYFAEKGRKPTAHIGFLNAENKPENTFKRKPHFDEYEDFFDNYDDAKAFAQNVEINGRKTTMDKVTAKEINIDVNGYSFLCIFGEHINGGFLAMPNWKICVELSADANDFAYNSDQIYMSIQHIKEFNGYYEKIADTLADEIRKEGY